MKRAVLNVLLPLLLVGSAAFGASQLVQTAATTERAPAETVDPLVRVTEVTAYDGPALVTGTGIVEPAREATLSPEVSGRILELSASLVEGGRVVQGESLIRIDGRAYKLALKQSKAEVDRAKASLELEESASEAARREWELSGIMPNDDARRVALRKPQVDSASAGIDSARGQAERAKLDLQKTTIRAPFNAWVRSESVEVGEVVMPGAVLATLVGTDRFWARISMPVESLSLIDLPRGDASGSKVTVVQELSAGKTVVRHGSVLRLVGALDTQSRTAQVLVEIEQPLDPPEGELPLLMGAFVTATIEGRPLDGAHVVPRDAVFDGNRVWVVDDDHKLQRRTLEVALANDETVIASGGIADGERVVTTRLRMPTEGMTVRVDDPVADEEQG